MPRPAPTAVIAVTPALLAAVLVSCAGRTPRELEAPPQPPAPPHQADPSFDWQGLVIAPFGSPLKDVPRKLHEALLFRDETHGASAGEEGECYAPDEDAPRFLGKDPDEYLLCFRQDRLWRIRASVHLAESGADALFDEACSSWQRAAVPNPPAAGAAVSAAANTGSAPSGGVCAGRLGWVRFSARLGPEAPLQDAESADEKSTVSIVLDGTPEP